MQKIKQIPDFYSDRVAAIHFSTFMYHAGEHKLTGGIVPVYFSVRVFAFAPPIKVPIWYTDLCTCSVSNKAKCHLTIPLILCKN